MPAFEPPAYVSSLIQAVNDGAKTAQSGAIAMAAFGIYLLAVAFSTTDEDLLLGHTTNIAQFGVQVAPQITFGVAPWVFVALHVFTLIRFDMLGTNLRALQAELNSEVAEPKDRERCRQILANVEFIMASIAPRESALHSRLFGAVAVVILAMFPVFVLLSEQISALRYQSELILWVQRAALLTDLSMLIWFFRRADADRTFGKKTWVRQFARIVCLMLLLVGNLAWLGILTRKEAEEEPNEIPSDPIKTFESGTPYFLRDIKGLDVSNRVLFAQIWPDAIAQIRRDTGVQNGNLAAIKGVFLPDRPLRGIVLNNSELYGANLVAADLTGANLLGAHLTGADLRGTTLEYATLAGADLKHANLINADLTGAFALNAHLEGAFLTGSNLTDVDLEDAFLKGAFYTNQKCPPDTKATIFPKGFDAAKSGLVLVDCNDMPVVPAK